MGRTLTFKIFRYNPYEEDSTPHMQEYQIEETLRLNIFNALNLIRDTQDPTLMFDFVCRAGICGSCSMMINGRPTLACRTLTSDLPTTIELYPLPFFKMLGDLSVDTGTWFRQIAEKIEECLAEKSDQELKTEIAKLSVEEAADIINSLDRGKKKVFKMIKPEDAGKVLFLLNRYSLNQILKNRGPLP